MKRLLFVFSALLICALLQGQETFPRNDVKDERANAYAFTNATLYINPTTVVEGATLLIRDGKIVAAGSGITVPGGYTSMDLDGKFVYPSLIDMYTSYGLPEIERERGRGFGGAEQIEPATKGPYNANDAIKSHYNASDEFSVVSKDATEMRKLGFGSVLTFKADGIARGTSALVCLGEETANSEMLAPKVAAHYSFDRGTSRQNFPASPMGSIALLRQTYMDADWFEMQTPRPFSDKSLEAWLENQSMPQIFETSDWMEALRADKVGDEFGVQYIIKTGTDAYRRIDEVKSAGAKLILGVNFPAAYDVEDPLDAERVSLEDMKHWELAPTNAATVAGAGIDFALTTHGLDKKSDFWGNVRKAIKHGLSEEDALHALTVAPASFLGASSRIGTLESGKEANFLITSGNLFEENTVIYQNWIRGLPYVINEFEADYSGKYLLAVAGEEYELEVSGKPGSHSMKIRKDTTTISVKSKLDGELVTMSFKPADEGTVRLSGYRDGNNWSGTCQTADGAWSDWSAEYQGELGSGDRTAARGNRGRSQDAPEVGEVIYPFVAHGMKEMPSQETILIRNATVWTNEDDGILENTDVLIENGVISRVGANLSSANARVIDGTGKHLTPGIVDEHSHLGASGINDRAANSSMVRIGDVVNSDHIGLYRALAGGVTTIQILHGSANPIGGQSALIKLRWGASPEGLKIQGADGFIKFALGENVKRSTSDNSVRYPQTRMGVEQVMVDAFTNALDYQQDWEAFRELSDQDSDEAVDAIPPRRDLVHETMLEIINGERFVTCHSYVQSEINMLMKVAEQFNFRINTFTHILEGYKVADKMAAHGVGGSTFSDWWNYKWEVRYAIPHNAAIMHREGVVTAINSDSGEMIRRLNQEAAKSIKYAGLSEEEALKLVTLNPAKLLHLDDRIGSIRVGKDGDVVLWNDHPLSIYAKPEKTIIDGTVFFDIDKDKELREYIAMERTRLIQKMLSEGKNGGAVARRFSRGNIDFHCDTMEWEDHKH